MVGGGRITLALIRLTSHMKSASSMSMISASGTTPRWHLGLGDGGASAAQSRLPGAFRGAVRKEADIATMAVGIILEAQQAEAILEKGRADLVAVGRQ
jgi:2,4-dienoyl-CoA reductase-like NADH-dependent reductase (Old Yellow Enzyme family)